MEPDELARRLNVTPLRFPRLLRCHQCAKTSDEHAHGWRGYRVEGQERIDGLSVVVYCPACVERIFGD